MMIHLNNFHYFRMRDIGVILLCVVATTLSLPDPMLLCGRGSETSSRQNGFGRQSHQGAEGHDSQLALELDAAWWGTSQRTNHYLFNKICTLVNIFEDHDAAKKGASNLTDPS